MELQIIERWVWPFYLDFLHGNFTSNKGIYSVCSPQQRSWEEWNDLLRRELREVTPEIAGDLIMDNNWRTQICGAYFCGFNRWDDFTFSIGNRLVANNNGFATQGYAFALARMPSHASANYLCGYLSHVGRSEDTTNRYCEDLDWVIGALQWVDAQMETQRFESYVERLIPIQQKQRFADLKSIYQRVPDYFVDHPINNSQMVQMEDKLLRYEKQLDTYFLPDDGKRHSERFWELMEFCQLHFDTPSN
ncbi:MAG TPA: DUF6000 family protein [Abditibacterium sp.]|jgi:hypothetical protein